MGPLAGVKVLELAHIMSGPTAGMLLADMGADVIKVEKIPGGDDTRRFTPPEVNGEASAFMMMNRNKRGIALDLADPAAQGSVEAHGRELRRRDRELSRGHYAEARAGIRRPAEGESRVDLLRGVGVRLTGPDAGKGGFDLVAQGISD